MIRRRYAFIAASAVLVGVAFVSCKGRTLDNVEPAGETVEVVVPEQAVVDSAAVDRSGIRLSDTL